MMLVPVLYAGDEPLPDNTTQRPKIGLALSGGGARGCAHVGVIAILEELGIPIDYIAGTSMGAVIGGLYSAGLSTAEMEYLLKNTDWEEAILDIPSRQDLAFRRKQDEQRYLLDLEIGLRGIKFILPTGLRDGQKLLQLLRTYSLQTTGMRSFDQLNIPFRAVATDLETGDAVVLDRGDLALAIRASMSIPGIFSPVALDGRLLADGGMSMNLPVEVVRSMGADFVIAVDISEPLYTRSQLNSFLGISYQTMSLLTRKNVLEQLPKADLVITPRVGDVTTLDFTSVSELIQSGREEALAQLEKLNPYRAEIQPETPSHQFPKTGVLADIQFENLEEVDPRQLLGRMDLKPGKSYTMDLLFKDLERLYGMNQFQLVDYRLEPTGEEMDLVVQVWEKPWGPNYIRFNFRTETNAHQGLLVSGLINLANTQINALGAEINTDLIFGDNPELSSEFYQPLDFSGKYFLSMVGALRREKISLADESREIAELNRDSLSLSLDVGRQFREYGALSLGILMGGTDLDLVAGDLEKLPAWAGLVDGSFRTGLFHLRLTLDQLNSATFPTQGYHFQLDASRSDPSILSADYDYQKVSSRFSRFFGNETNTFSMIFNLGTSFKKGLPTQETFALGGLGQLSGYRNKSLRGNHFAILNLGYLRSLYRFPSLGRFFAGGFLEGGREWQELDDVKLTDFRTSTTLVLGADTILGPVYLSGAINDERDFNYYLTMGVTLFSR